MEVKIRLTKEQNRSFYNSDFIFLDLEEYVNGCVAQEIGNADVAACAAQAVAARTNAYYYVLNNKELSDDSSKFQAFSIERMKSPTYWNAYLGTELTTGQILYYNGKIAYPASFSSNNGGRIVSAEERWGGKRAWLISKTDPYDIGDKTGHGVGLSQRGAKAMAKQGYTYKEILKFYFPNTELEMINMGNSNKVKQYALSKIGCGYVWGATGQTLTQSALNSLVDKYSDHIDTSIVKKWIGKQVFDCASLVRLAMKEAGVSMVSGATSQWNKTSWAEKGTIDTLPKNKVCLLYRATSPTNMQHTGIYLGDGTFVDARGSQQGVLHSKIESYKWTHWGIPVGLNNDQEVFKVLYQGIISTPNGGGVNFRQAASTSSAILATLKSGTKVDIISVSNPNWTEIVHNGLTGFISSQYIEVTADTSAQKHWYIKVECEDEQDAKQLVEAIQKIAKAKVVSD